LCAQPHRRLPNRHNSHPLSNEQQTLTPHHCRIKYTQSTIKKINAPALFRKVRLLIKLVVLQKSSLTGFLLSFPSAFIGNPAFKQWFPDKNIRERQAKRQKTYLKDQ
jgi:hypothetical protein